MNKRHASKAKQKINLKWQLAIKLEKYLAFLQIELKLVDYDAKKCTKLVFIHYIKDAVATPL